MGESRRYQDYRKIKRSRFSLGHDESNALMALFVLNVIFFLFLLTPAGGLFFYQQTPDILDTGSTMV